MPKLVFLKTEQDFSNFKKSRTLVSPNFRIRWLSVKNQNTPRFGFIIPKKVVKKVTDRNVIKRRVKAILGKHIKNIKPYDILFFPKPGSIKIRFKDLEEELLSLLRKALLYAST
jgi:ribonuclease P protein component